jgi:hypothetical protein
MKASKFNGSKNIATFLIVLATVISGVAAVLATDFSGTWALDQAKSNLPEGRGGRGAAAKLTVTQDKDAVLVLRTNNGQNGEVVTTEKLTLDGKEVLATGGREGSVRKSTLTVSPDKNSLTVNSDLKTTFGDQTFESKIKEVWTLSADGKTLTIDQESVSQRGTTTLKLVYNKQ